MVRTARIALPQERLLPSERPCGPVALPGPFRGRVDTPAQMQWNEPKPRRLRV
jgi:hypothetical protein